MRVSRRSRSERLDGLLGVMGDWCDSEGRVGLGECMLSSWKSSKGNGETGSSAVTVAGLSASVGVRGGWTMRRGEGVTGRLGVWRRREARLGMGLSSSGDGLSANEGEGEQEEGRQLYRDAPIARDPDPDPAEPSCGEQMTRSMCTGSAAVWFGYWLHCRQSSASSSAEQGTHQAGIRHRSALLIPRKGS